MTEHTKYFTGRIIFLAVVSNSVCQGVFKIIHAVLQSQCFAELAIVVFIWVVVIVSNFDLN